MLRYLAIALLAGAGCAAADDVDAAPADLAAPPDLAPVADLSVPDQAGSPDLAGPALAGRVFALDTLDFISGAIGWVDEPQAPRSAPSTLGFFRIPIPPSACGQHRFVRFEGTTSSGLKLLPILRAPRIPIDCAGDTQIFIAHVYLDDSGPQAVRQAIASELVGRGELAVADGGTAAEALDADHAWMFGRMIAFESDGTEHFFRGGTVVMSGDGGACKLYYANGYGRFSSGAVPTLIAFDATVSPGSLVVVCPRSLTQEITLEASGFVESSAGTPATFPPVTFPMNPGGSVSLEWDPTSY